VSGENGKGAAFKWVYFMAIAAMIVAVVCFPFRMPLSFLLAGYDPALYHEDSFESFQAYHATRGLRDSFLPAAGYVAALVLALSIVAVVMRSRGKLEIPWVVPVISLILSAIVATLAWFGSIVPTTGVLG
jgi:hypothetical protein